MEEDQQKAPRKDGNKDALSIPILFHIVNNLSVSIIGIGNKVQPRKHQLLRNPQYFATDEFFET